MPGIEQQMAQDSMYYWQNTKTKTNQIVKSARYTLQALYDLHNLDQDTEPLKLQFCSSNMGTICPTRLLGQLKTHMYIALHSN